MNIPQFLPVAAAALSLLLSVWLFISNSTNSGLQGELQKKQTEVQSEQEEVQLQNQQLQVQQEQIATALRLQQEIGPAVLREIGTLAVQNKNDKLRKLLGKRGITIQEGQEQAKAEAPKPASAPEKPAEAPKPAVKP
jgi:hypothetical protein